jgi:hypothetical protein
MKRKKAGGGKPPGLFFDRGINLPLAIGKAYHDPPFHFPASPGKCCVEVRKYKPKTNGVDPKKMRRPATAAKNKTVI